MSWELEWSVCQCIRENEMISVSSIHHSGWGTLARNISQCCRSSPDQESQEIPLPWRNVWSARHFLRMTKAFSWPCNLLCVFGEVSVSVTGLVPFSSFPSFWRGDWDLTWAPALSPKGNNSLSQDLWRSSRIWPSIWHFFKLTTEKGRQVFAGEVLELIYPSECTRFRTSKKNLGWNMITCFLQKYSSH